MNQRVVCRRFAFTIVELLVVIAVLTVSVVMLLPAVNAARETARWTQCKNHLHQIGLAFLAYESSHRTFPSGGWSKEWTADPNRGFGKSQPGSWLYSLLPFIEAQDLFLLGSGVDMDSDEYRQLNERRHQTPLAVYHCPSRRAAVAYRHGWRLPCYNCDSIPFLPAVAKNDYAANAGDGTVNSGDGPDLNGPFRIPRSYEEADHGFGWIPTNQSDPDSPHYAAYCSGVVYIRSEVRAGDVKDGLTKTYFGGEKYLSVRSYDFTEPSLADNQSMYTGFEFDNTRLTHLVDTSHEPRYNPYAPMRDGIGENTSAFGSAHPMGVNMIMCDGSVNTLVYGISDRVHSLLGNRHDGQTIDW